MSKNITPGGERPKFAVPISWKLLASTVVVGAVAVAIALSGLQRMNVLNERLNEIVDVAAERVKLASLLRQYLLTVTRAEKNMIFANSEEELQGYFKTIDEVLNGMRQHESKLRTMVSNDDLAQLDNYAQKWEQWQTNHQRVRNLSGVHSQMRARELSLDEAQEWFERLDESLQALVADAKAAFEHLPTDETETDPQQNALSSSSEMLEVAAGIRHAVMNMQRAEKNMLLATNREELAAYESQISSLAERIERGLKTFSESAPKSTMTELAETHEAWDQYKKLNAQITVLAGETGSGWALELAYNTGGPLASEAESLVDSIIQSNSEKLDELKRNSGRLFRRLRITLIVFSLLGIGTSVAVSYFTGRRISKNLSTLAGYAQNVRRAKDLSQPIPRVSNDEVGKLAEAFDDMRETVYRQTRELAKLNQTLKHKNDEMEQFVYTVSHDLKSPLVSCKGLLGLLREDIADGDPEEVEHSISRLGQATDQLSQIIDDLLALSRIGRKPLNLSEIDVSDLLATLSDQLADRIEAVGAELRIIDPLPPVVGDKSDVKRAFENLLTNAIKYAGERAVIEIGGKQQEKELLYYVRDNGPGIEIQYHKKVFGLFQRLDTSQPGTGLGLASVQKIMRMHGGRVWVESQPNDGATFWLSFPWRKPPTL